MLPMALLWSYGQTIDKIASLIHTQPSKRLKLWAPKLLPTSKCILTIQSANLVQAVALTLLPKWIQKVSSTRLINFRATISWVQPMLNSNIRLPNRRKTVIKSSLLFKTFWHKILGIQKGTRRTRWQVQMSNISRMSLDKAKMVREHLVWALAIQMIMISIWCTDINNHWKIVKFLKLAVSTRALTYPNLLQQPTQPLFDLFHKALIRNKKILARSHRRQ